MGDELLKDLYSSLTADNYDLGTYDKFVESFALDENRRNLHQAMIKDNYDIGDFDQFTRDSEKAFEGIGYSYFPSHGFAPKIEGSETVDLADGLSSSSAMYKNLLAARGIDLDIETPINNQGETLRQHLDRATMNNSLEETISLLENPIDNTEFDLSSIELETPESDRIKERDRIEDEFSQATTDPRIAKRREELKKIGVELNDEQISKMVRAETETVKGDVYSSINSAFEGKIPQDDILKLREEIEGDKGLLETLGDFGDKFNQSVTLNAYEAFRNRADNLLTEYEKKSGVKLNENVKQSLARQLGDAYEGEINGAVGVVGELAGGLLPFGATAKGVHKALQFVAPNVAKSLGGKTITQTIAKNAFETLPADVIDAVNITLKNNNGEFNEDDFLLNMASSIGMGTVAGTIFEKTPKIWSSIKEKISGQTDPYKALKEELELAQITDKEIGNNSGLEIKDENPDIGKTIIEDIDEVPVGRTGQDGVESTSGQGFQRERETLVKLREQGSGDSHAVYKEIEQKLYGIKDPDYETPVDGVAHLLNNKRAAQHGYDQLKEMWKDDPAKLSDLTTRINNLQNMTNSIVDKIRKEPEIFPHSDKFKDYDIERALKDYSEGKSIDWQNKDAYKIEAIKPEVAGLPILDLTPVGKAVKDRNKTFQKYFTSRGNLTKEIYDETVFKEGRIAAELKEATINERKVEGAINKLKLDKDTTAKIREDINKVLAGKKKYSEINESLRQSVADMRAHIDKLSKAAIDEGVVQGELEVKFDKNSGSYVTRSYKIHDAPVEWREHIENTPDGQRIWNKAVSYIREQRKDLNEDEIQGLVNSLLIKDNAANFMQSGKLGSKDLGTLKKRKNISPEIRDLLGENTDGLLNYARSITKMANLVENHKFLTKIKKDGFGKVFHEKPTGKHAAQLAAEGSKTISPLNGLYTTPELKEAFEEYYKTEQSGWLFAKYLRFNSFVKLSKTVLSPMTHARNMVGNIGFALANGHIDPKEFKSSFIKTWDDLRNQGKFTNKLKEYRELGIIDDGADAGEMFAIIKDKNGIKRGAEKFLSDGTVATKDKLFRAVGNLYQAEDNIWKIYAYEVELKRYKKAAPDMPEIEKHVAGIIRDTYPTYSKVAEGIKKLRRLPVGNFVSFPAEVVRTFIKRLEIAYKEINSGNKELRKIGVKRIAGTIASVTAASGIAAMSRGLFGISEQKDKDTRRFLAEWEKNTTIVYTNDSGGFIDIGNTDPHSYLTEPLKRILAGGDIGDNAYQGAKDLLQPFFGIDITAGVIIDLVSNTNSYNHKPIINGKQPILDKLYDGMNYSVNRLSPTVFKNMDKIFKDINGETDNFGKEYSAVNELTGMFTGFKKSNLDAKQAMELGNFPRFRKGFDESRQIYRKASYNSKISEDEKKLAYDKAYEAAKGTLDEFREDYQAFLRLGGKKEDIDVFLKGRTSKLLYDAITTGNNENLEIMVTGETSGSIKSKFKRNATSLIKR